MISIHFHKELVQEYKDLKKDQSIFPIVDYFINSHNLIC